MERTPEEQEMYDAVYQDRVQYLKQYPKTVAILSVWVANLESAKSLYMDEKLKITKEATIQAYNDELKRLLLLDLITQ